MTLLRSPRFLLLFICAAGLILPVVAVIMTHALNLAACPLCILQRMAYLGIALFAGIGLICARHRAARRAAAFLAAILAGGGALIAGYQVWIQRVAPSITCGGRQPWWERFVDWAGDQWPLLFHADGQCADTAWTLLGLSLADWSALAFVTLSFLALLAARRRAG